MPCLGDDGDPGGTVIEDVQIESHVDVNERRDPVLGWPRDMSSRQKDPVTDQNAAAGGQDPRRDSCIIGFDPNNS